MQRGLLSALLSTRLLGGDKIESDSHGTLRRAGRCPWEGLPRPGQGPLKRGRGPAPLDLLSFLKEWESWIRKM